MKKKILLTVAFVLTIGVVGAQATATTQDYSTAIPADMKGSLSTNVKMAYKSSADNSGYTAGTYHEKGTRTFGASSGDAALYYSITTATAIPAAPSGTDTADFNSATWTKI